MKELLHYNPETGVFTWLKNRGIAKAGSIAGRIDRKGYVYIKVNISARHAARLAFLYMTGEWPPELVDHINGVRSDNRWSNLRAVNNGQNKQNIRVANKNNKSSGLLGASKQDGRWAAKINVGGKRIWLGTFDTPQEANSAYMTAKRSLHPFAEISK